MDSRSATPSLLPKVNSELFSHMMMLVKKVSLAEVFSFTISDASVLDVLALDLMSLFYSVDLSWPIKPIKRPLFHIAIMYGVPNPTKRTFHV